MLISHILPLTQKASYILTKNGGSALNEQLNEFGNLMDEYMCEKEREKGEVEQRETEKEKKRKTERLAGEQEKLDNNHSVWFQTKQTIICLTVD